MVKKSEIKQINPKVANSILKSGESHTVTFEDTLGEFAGIEEGVELIRVSAVQLARWLDSEFHGGPNEVDKLHNKLGGLADSCAFRGLVEPYYFTFYKNRLQSIVSADETIRLQDAGANLSLEVRDKLVNACLFLVGGAVSGEEEKQNLLKFMGRIDSDSQELAGSSYERSFFAKSRDINQYLGGSAFEAWDEARRNGLVTEGDQGFYFGYPFVAALERATGKTLAEAQAIYKQTRTSGERKIG